MRPRPGNRCPWEGEADFHALEVAGDRLFGYDGLSGTLMTSTDRSTWYPLDEIDIVDFAANPTDPALIVATTPDAEGLVSRDSGRDFNPLSGAPGLILVDWAADHLVGLSPDGTVHVSADEGETWQVRGAVPGPGQALDAAGDRWHAATTDGIFVSTDVGKNSLEARSVPDMSRASGVRCGRHRS